MSAETRASRWAPETDLQWGLCHLDSHREKTTETSGALIIRLCCSWNKLLVRLARGELPPRLSLVSPKVLFSILSPMEFWFLAAVTSGLLSSGHFPAISPTWLHRYHLNWTELDNDITEFNNEMPLTEIFSCFDIVQLLWHNLYC